MEWRLPVLVHVLAGKLVIIHRALVGCLFEAAADRTQSLAFGALNVGGISAAPAFELQVLANRIIEYAHGRKPTRL
jgi:hypothetical protein